MKEIEFGYSMMRQLLAYVKFLYEEVQYKMKEVASVRKSIVKL
jgi:hypothetical protein